MQMGKIELQALGTLKDRTGSPGTATNTIFSSTGTATEWIPAPTGSTPVGTNAFDLCDTTTLLSVGNVTWATRMFVVNTLVVNRIACYTNSAGAGNARMGIYDDSGSKVTNAESSTNTSIVAGLNVFTIPTITLSSGTFYYLVLQSVSASVGYFMNAGYLPSPATAYIRARYIAGSTTDPDSGMVSSISTLTASANALWASVYKV